MSDPVANATVDAAADAPTVTITHSGGMVFRSADTGARLFSIRPDGALRLSATAGKGFPSWYALRAVDLVQGVTLDRLCLTAGAGEVAVGNQCTAWLKSGQALREINCDRCPGPHTSMRATCSATLGIPTAMTVPDSWYDVETGAFSQVQWIIVDVEGGRSRVSRVTLQRIQ